MVHKTNPDQCSETCYPDMVCGFTKREIMALELAKVYATQLQQVVYGQYIPDWVAEMAVITADKIIARLNGEHLTEDKNND